MSTSRPRRSSSLLAVVVAAAGLAGCAYQDPFSLPPLGSPGSGASSGSPYYGYSGGYYDPRYRSYDPRYGLYSSYSYDPRLAYYYGGGYPGYYGPLPYPAPGHYPYPRAPYCLDANRDGRCDDRRGDGRGNGHGNGSGSGNGNGNGNGGQVPGFDPKRDPFEQVREATRRADQSRSRASTPTPAVMAPAVPRQERPAEPKRSTEPRRVTEPKRNSSPPPSGWKAVGEASSGLKRAPRDDVARTPAETN
jgi:hypothetical protein